MCVPVLFAIGGAIASAASAVVAGVVAIGSVVATAAVAVGAAVSTVASAIWGGIVSLGSWVGGALGFGGTAVSATETAFLAANAGSQALGATTLASAAAEGTAIAAANVAATASVAGTVTTAASSTANITAILNGVVTASKVASGVMGVVGLFTDTSPDQSASGVGYSASDHDRSLRLEKGWLATRWDLEQHNTSPLTEGEPVEKVKKFNTPSGLSVGKGAGGMSYA